MAEAFSYCPNLPDTHTAIVETTREFYEAVDALGISASNAGPHLSTLGRDLSSIADTYRYIDPKRRDIVGMQ